MAGVFPELVVLPERTVDVFCVGVVLSERVPLCVGVVLPERTVDVFCVGVVLSERVPLCAGVVFPERTVDVFCVGVVLSERVPLCVGVVLPERTVVELFCVGAVLSVVVALPEEVLLFSVEVAALLFSVGVVVLVFTEVFPGLFVLSVPTEALPAGRDTVPSERVFVGVEVALCRVLLLVSETRVFAVRTDVPPVRMVFS